MKIIFIKRTQMKRPGFHVVTSVLLLSTSVEHPYDCDMNTNKVARHQMDASPKSTEKRINEQKNIFFIVSITSFHWMRHVWIFTNRNSDSLFVCSVNWRKTNWEFQVQSKVTGATERERERECSCDKNLKLFYGRCCCACDDNNKSNKSDE